MFAERSLIDSLNLTDVLSYLKLTDVSEVTVGFKGSIKMWADSVYVFIRSIGAPTDSLVDVFLLSRGSLHNTVQRLVGVKRYSCSIRRRVFISNNSMNILIREVSWHSSLWCFFWVFLLSPGVN